MIFAALVRRVNSCPIRPSCRCISTVRPSPEDLEDSKPATLLFQVKKKKKLILQIHFLSKSNFAADFGITTGEQISSSPCAFRFNSTTSTNGTFWSPNFPGFYPRDTECHYFFHAQVGERVKIVFSYFDIEGMVP